VLANINIGLLYIFAISSLGVYGVVIAGWASNSKYPFFSAMRAAAQMISYEVSIGFIIISVVLWSGSFNLQDIILGQKSHVGIINAYGVNPLLFPMAVLFLISAMAETARAPFDLTEAESELVAGYQTEYSSMSFALFWLGEYANVLLMCALNAILFWGGWLPPIDWAPLYHVPGIIWLFIKIFAFFFIFSWVKATVPRYRYDQLMRLGWKIFLPMSLFWVFLVSGYLMLTRYEVWVMRLVLLALFIYGVSGILLPAYAQDIPEGKVSWLCLFHDTGARFKVAELLLDGVNNNRMEDNKPMIEHWKSKYNEKNPISILMTWPYKKNEPITINDPNVILQNLSITKVQKSKKMKKWHMLLGAKLSERMFLTLESSKDKKHYFSSSIFPFPNSLHQGTFEGGDIAEQSFAEYNSLPEK